MALLDQREEDPSQSYNSPGRKWHCLGVSTVKEAREEVRQDFLYPLLWYFKSQKERQADSTETVIQKEIIKLPICFFGQLSTFHRLMYRNFLHVNHYLFFLFILQMFLFAIYLLILYMLFYYVLQKTVFLK